MESPRLLIAPIVGFLVLQFHRHMVLPLPMELLVSMIAVLPYMMPRKTTREIGIQTDSDDVIVKRMVYTPIAILAVGIIPLMVLMVTLF